MGGKIGSHWAYNVEDWYAEQAETEQFRYWQAFHRIQPWGPWRDNYHAALVCATLLATNPNGAQDVSPAKFMLDTSDQPEEEAAFNEQAMLAAGQAMGLKFIENPCPPSPTSP